MDEETQVLNNNNQNNIKIKSPQYQDPNQPFIYKCKECNNTISTKVEHKIGSGTWVCALIWCNCFFLPGLIPFCVDSCKDSIHKCPECNKDLHKYYYEPCNCDKNEQKL